MVFGSETNWIVTWVYGFIMIVDGKHCISISCQMCNLVGVELFFDYSGGSLLQHKSGGGDIDHHVEFTVASLRILHSGALL